MQHQAWLLDSRWRRDESHPVQQQGPLTHDHTCAEHFHAEQRHDYARYHPLQQQGPHPYDLVILNTLFDNKEVMDLSDFYKATSPYVVTRHIEGTRNVKYYQCCSEPYIDLNFR